MGGSRLCGVIGSSHQGRSELGALKGEALSRWLALTPGRSLEEETNLERGTETNLEDREETGMEN